LIERTRKFVKSAVKTVDNKFNLVAVV